MNFGLPELLVVSLVVILFFVPKRLPELAKNIGKSVKDFKKGLRGEEDIKIVNPEEPSKKE